MDGDGTLVLNHLVPGVLAEEDGKRAQNGYSGRLVVGNDLDVINVGS